MLENRYNDFYRSEIETLDLHWKAYRETNSEANIDIAKYSLNTALKKFVTTLQSLPYDVPENRVLFEIKELFDLLDQINDSTGHLLFESSACDVIVPFVCRAVELAGLDLDHYADRDPTMAFRRF